MAHAPLTSSWFNNTSITYEVRSLDEEAAEASGKFAAGETPTARVDDPMRLVWGVVIIVGGLLLGLVVILFIFGQRKPGQELTPFGIVRAVGIIALVLGGGALATKYYHVGKTAGAGQREEALQQLAARADGLRLAHYSPITGPSVGSVPWLASEIDMPVHCNLHGSYGGHPLTLLECTYVVDMSLSKLEASMGKLAAKIMSHIEHEGVQRRSLEAIVFFEPLTGVPDLFLAPRDEPLHWYFEKRMQKAGTPIRPLAGSDSWLATSDDDACARVLTPELQRSLRDAGVILQVFCGYCIVITKTWSANFPKDMPHRVEQIDANLKLACALYEGLAGGRPPIPRPAPQAVPRSEPAFAAAAPSLDRDTAEPPPPITPAPPRSWHRPIGAGVGALLFGALTLALEVPHYPPEKLNFPNLLGQATFPMMIGAAVGLFIGHRIQRNTWRRLVAPGIGALLCGGLALAVYIPKRPPEQITFTFVLAYSLIPMVFGAAVGALVGWLVRRMK